MQCCPRMVSDPKGERFLTCWTIFYSYFYHVKWIWPLILTNWVFCQCPFSWDMLPINHITCGMFQSVFWAFLSFNFLLPLPHLYININCQCSALECIPWYKGEKRVDLLCTVATFNWQTSPLWYGAAPGGFWFTGNKIYKDWKWGHLSVHLHCQRDTWEY